MMIIMIKQKSIILILLSYDKIIRYLKVLFMSISDIILTICKRLTGFSLNSNKILNNYYIDGLHLS